jgi:hypothetical protein
MLNSRLFKFKSQEQQKRQTYIGYPFTVKKAVKSSLVVSRVQHFRLGEHGERVSNFDDTKVREKEDPKVSQS